MRNIFYVVRLFWNLKKITKDPNNTAAGLSVAEILEATAQGWIMGRNAKSIFAISWDQKYETQLSDLRAEYGIKALN